MINTIAYIGRFFIEYFEWAKGVLRLFGQTLFWLVVGPFSGKTSQRQSIFQQMVFVGLKSIVIVFFVDLFTGIVLGMQSAYLLKKMGAEIYIASLVSISLCRELSPVLTALVVAGRAGSAIAAELGTMKVTEQIEALEVMAINPVRFLSVPRFLALLLMVPALTVLGNLSGIFGGYLVGTGSLNISSDLYMQITFKYLELKDIYTGLFKSVVFGIIIALVSCYEGLTTEGGAEGVGRATTRSVVISFILVIAADCLLTAFFYVFN
ncbi:MAG: ABC transporter permease [Candidatus Omnitrophica bacterium]|nr:ABC transporter permease [Candidatus Omnitrophota bacterium]